MSGGEQGKGTGSAMRDRPLTASATIKDVAQEAGVGVGTVSRVVNGAANVSDDTRLRVEAAIRRLNFDPNPIAQSLRSGHTKMFACIVRDFSVPILSAFVNGMQASADARGFSLQVASSYHDTEREIEMLKRLARRRVDGIVIATSSEADTKLLDTLTRLEVPVVLLDRDYPQTSDAVQINHRAAVRDAIAHLLELGHRRIGFLTGQLDVRPAQERLAGFEEAFRARGLEATGDLIRSGSFAAEFAYSEVMGLLNGRQPPTAIFAGGAGMLAPVLRAVRDQGLRIPEDISVVTGADSELAVLHTPPISAVRWQHDQLGALAAQFLLARLDGAAVGPQRTLAPAEYIQRGSCGPAPKQSSTV